MRIGATREFVKRLGLSLAPDAPRTIAPNSANAIAYDELQAYRSALDRVAIIGVTDVRGRIVDVNDQFCAISGYAPDELIGATHSLLNSGHHPRSFFDELWKTISTGQVWRSDICNRAKSGKLYWVDTTIAPLRDPTGRLRGYVSIRFDITARKVAEEKALLESLRRQDSEMLLAGLLATSSKQPKGGKRQA